MLFKSCISQQYFALNHPLQFGDSIEVCFRDGSANGRRNTLRIIWFNWRSDGDIGLDGIGLDDYVGIFLNYPDGLKDIDKFPTQSFPEILTITTDNVSIILHSLLLIPTVEDRKCGSY